MAGNSSRLIPYQPWSARAERQRNVVPPNPIDVLDAPFSGDVGSGLRSDLCSRDWSAAADLNAELRYFASRKYGSTVPLSLTSMGFP